MSVTVRHWECHLLSGIGNVSYCEALGMSVTVRHWESQLLSGIWNGSYCQAL
jgi:hypothetical protein